MANEPSCSVPHMGWSSPFFPSIAFPSVSAVFIHYRDLLVKIVCNLDFANPCFNANWVLFILPFFNTALSYYLDDLYLSFHVKLFSFQNGFGKANFVGTIWLYGKQNVNLEIGRRTVEKTNSVDQNSRLKTKLRILFIYFDFKKKSDRSCSLVCNKTRDVTRFT